MTSHPLTNFKIRKYFQNGSRINGDYSRDNLPKRIKDETNIINLDDYAAVGTYWIAFDCKNIGIIYFDSFGVAHVPKVIE